MSDEVCLDSSRCLTSGSMASKSELRLLQRFMKRPSRARNSNGTSPSKASRPLPPASMTRWTTAMESATRGCSVSKMYSLQCVMIARMCSIEMTTALWRTHRAGFCENAGSICRMSRDCTDDRRYRLTCFFENAAAAAEASRPAANDAAADGATSPMPADTLLPNSSPCDFFRAMYIAWVPSIPRISRNISARDSSRGFGTASSPISKHSSVYSLVAPSDPSPSVTASKSPRLPGT
mmetsp:Transcript_23802/g.59157  ORF Transcript_23802/g.59157 Transcript_23802/m.59157 type:complete len:236 (+) Transcript_23802:362-1069(+)